MKTSLSENQIHKDGFLAEAANLWPMAKGSLAEVRKPCVRPSCSICKEGKRHPSFIFSFMEGGRRKCMHVPRELVPRLRHAILNGRLMERRMVQTACEMIRAHRRQRDLLQHRKGDA